MVITWPHNCSYIHNVHTYICTYVRTYIYPSIQFPLYSFSCTNRCITNGGSVDYHKLTLRLSKPGSSNLDDPHLASITGRDYTDPSEKKWVPAWQHMYCTGLHLGGGRGVSWGEVEGSFISLLFHNYNHDIHLPNPTYICTSLKFEFCSPLNKTFLYAYQHCLLLQYSVYTYIHLNYIHMPILCTTSTVLYVYAYLYLEWYVCHMYNVCLL